MTKTLKPVSVTLKPTLFCLGKVAAVGEAKMKPETGNVSVRVDIAPLGSAPKSTFWVLLFDGVFSDEKFADNSKLDRNYKANIAQGYPKSVKPLKRYYPGQNSVNQYVGLGKLDGLFNDDAVLAGHVQNIREAYLSGENDSYLGAIDAMMTETIGRKVGYILKQRFEETDELNEKGYPVKVPGEYYELSGFFPPSDDGIAEVAEVVDAWENLNKPVKALLMFDPTQPFDGSGTEEIPF